MNILARKKPSNRNPQPKIQMNRVIYSNTKFPMIRRLFSHKSSNYFESFFKCSNTKRCFIHNASIGGWVVRECARRGGHVVKEMEK